MDDKYFNFDLEQMKKALESPMIMIPDWALESDESFCEWLDIKEFIEEDNKDVNNKEEK